MKKGLDYIGVAVGVTLFNDKGQIFLSKRGQEVRNEKGTWEGPGGSIDFGESMEDAIKREMKEEYDIDIEIIKKFPAEDHFIPEEKQHWVATTFWASIKEGQEPKIMEPHKCDAIGWFDLDSLPQPLSIITQIDLKKVKQYRESLELDSAVFYSNDINKIVDFYKNVIGLEVEYQGGDKFVSFMFPNGTRLGIKKKVEEREVPGMQTIFIGVADVESHYRRFKDMNQRFYKELTEESWGKQFSILDPDENKVLFRSKR